MSRVKITGLCQTCTISSRAYCKVQVGKERTLLTTATYFFSYFEEVIKINTFTTFLLWNVLCQWRCLFENLTHSERRPGHLEGLKAHMAFCPIGIGLLLGCKIEMGTEELKH